VNLLLSRRRWLKDLSGYLDLILRHYIDEDDRRLLTALLSFLVPFLSFDVAVYYLLGLGADLREKGLEIHPLRIFIEWKFLLSNV
jgi:hypothetical protein